MYPPTMPDEDCDLWVNEEGLFEALPYNSIASEILNTNPAYAYMSGYQPLVGDVIITGGSSEEGEQFGLTEQKAAEVFSLAARALVSRS